MSISTPKIILHIPHSSTIIPIREGFIVNDEIIDKEVLKLTDWHTEDLFFSEVHEMIVYPYSRIFCDPERFEDDNLEVMAKVGMGVLYEKSDSGTTIRKVNPKLKDLIINNYYHKHHKQLTAAVNHQLKLFGKVLILDCHSFPNSPFERDLSQNPNRPDFNIGTDSFHTPKYLIDESISFFENKGYSLGIDWPYSGTIVPLLHYQKNKNVNSIMLEINRKLYMNEANARKTENYHAVKKVIGEYLQFLNSIH